MRSSSRACQLMDIVPASRTDDQGKEMFYVMCRNCGARGPATSDGSSHDPAVDLWWKWVYETEQIHHYPQNLQ